MDSQTKHLVEIESGMSNLDHEIDPGFADDLRSRPNEVFGRHAAWNFNGKVWFDGTQFCEEVWVYRVPRAIVRADNLKDLMSAVNRQFGSD